MREAFDRVKVPLAGIFGIVLITLISFAVVNPAALRGQPHQWTITGNAIADDALFNAKITAAAPCADVQDLVCGADGQTYANLCEARKAGTDMRHHGAC